MSKMETLKNYRSWKVVKDIPEGYISSCSSRVPIDSWYVDIEGGRDMFEYALGGPDTGLPALLNEGILERLIREGYLLEETEDHIILGEN